MVERLSEQPVTNVDAEKYWRLGGILDRYSLEKAADVLLGLVNGKKPKVGGSSLIQGENIARASGVPITMKQCSVYGVLRELVENAKERSHHSPEETRIMPVWIMSDQQLMTEVLLLTGDE